MVEDLVVRGNIVDGSGSYVDPRMHGRGSGIQLPTELLLEPLLIRRRVFLAASCSAAICALVLQTLTFLWLPVSFSYRQTIVDGGA